MVTLHNTCFCASYYAVSLTKVGSISAGLLGSILHFDKKFNLFGAIFEFCQWAYLQECAILPSQVGIWPQNAELVTPTSYLHIFFWK